MERITEQDKNFLKQCLQLAQESLDAGDEPFGSVLVDESGSVIASSRNRVNEINALAHPEIDLARWALENMKPEHRKTATMYTTGEHCPMCAGAHGWAGIGSLVYLASGMQLSAWFSEFGRDPAPINFIPVQDILKDIVIKGPVEGYLLDQIKEMHHKSYLTIQNSK